MSTTQKPEFSVIVAAYNAAETLERCIKSIQAQTLQNFEIVICDDKSQDNTLALARNLAQQDSRIIIVEKSENSGPGGARNTALDQATGEWIVIVDSDDTISPQRLEKMKDAAEKNAVDIVFDNLVYHPMGNAGEYPYLPDTLTIFGPLLFETYAASSTVSNPLPNLGFLKPVIRRSLLEQNTIRYDETLRIGEDSVLIFNLFAGGAKSWLMREPFYHYYKNKNSISAVFDAEKIRKMAESLKIFLTKNGRILKPQERSAVESLEKDLRLRLKAREVFGNMSFASLRETCALAYKDREIRTYLYRELRQQIKKIISK